MHPLPLLRTLEDIQAEGLPCVQPLEITPVTSPLPEGFQGLERNNESGLLPI